MSYQNGKAVFENRNICKQISKFLNLSKEFCAFATKAGVGHKINKLYLSYRIENPKIEVFVGDLAFITTSIIIARCINYVSIAAMMFVNFRKLSTTFDCMSNLRLFIWHIFEFSLFHVDFLSGTFISLSFYFSTCKTFPEASSANVVFPDPLDPE